MPENTVKTQQILIDCGCNTFMMNEAFAKWAKLKARALEETTAIDWGNSDGTSHSDRAVQTTMELWGDNGTYHQTTDERTFLLAPLRVDVILGLPLFHWMIDLTIKKVGERPGLTFKNQAGETITITAQTTHRRWESATCAAVHL
jgi:hypothetical protein